MSGLVYKITAAGAGAGAGGSKLLPQLISLILSFFYCRIYIVFGIFAFLVLKKQYAEYSKAYG